MCTEAAVRLWTKGSRDYTVLSMDVKNKVLSRACRIADLAKGYTVENEL